MSAITGGSTKSWPTPTNSAQTSMRHAMTGVSQDKYYFAMDKGGKGKSSTPPTAAERQIQLPAGNATCPS
eukprot:4701804-Amphidinium_carterae.1